jgi:hypothetical protein
MKSTCQVFLYALILVPVWTIVLFVFIPVTVALLILSSIATGDWNWKRSSHHLDRYLVRRMILQETRAQATRAQSLRNRKLQFESINWQRDGF